MEEKKEEEHAEKDKSDVENITKAASKKNTSEKICNPQIRRISPIVVKTTASVVSGKKVKGTSKKTDDTIEVTSIETDKDTMSQQRTETNQSDNGIEEKSKANDKHFSCK